MGQQFDYSVSASKLNLFNEDPLLFWLIEKEILNEPDAIFAGITRGLDSVTKT